MNDHPETTAAERFLLALLEDGETWNEMLRGLYESIKAGHITCDEDGRGLSMTESGRHYVQSRPDLIAYVEQLALGGKIDA